MLQELRQMAIFAKAIDHGSFRSAAKAMNLSPSVVSQQISDLEKRLGTALIYRSTRSLSLTADGEKLLSSARNMVNEAEAGLNSISERSSDPSGVLRVTLPAVLSQSKLVKYFTKFMEIYPNIELVVDFSDIRKSLISDGYDLAIRMGWLQDSALISRKLSSMDRRLVASKTYVNAKPIPTSPNDLKSWNWIELSAITSKTKKFYDSNGASLSIKSASRITVNDAQALYQFAKSGAGLALVPAFLAEEDIEKGIVEYVLPDWHVEDLGIYAVWPENAPKHGLTRLLVDHLANQKY